MRTEAASAKPSQGSDALTLGVLSDTHGHMDEAARDILRGADLILHAGDIDGPAILATLEAMAPVVAVRGNMDRGAWADRLPDEEIVEAGAIRLYMIHDLTRISLDPETADIRIVVSGHTHRPKIREKGGVVYLNPGSASLPRGGHRPTVALVEITGPAIACRHVAF